MALVPVWRVGITAVQNAGTEVAVSGSVIGVLAEGTNFPATSTTYTVGTAVPVATVTAS